MEKKIENLCNFIENELYQISNDSEKLSYSINCLKSMNVFILKSVLKATFNKNDSNDIIIKRLCSDFFIEYDDLILIPIWLEKINKYINYFKIILYI